MSEAISFIIIVLVIFGMIVTIPFWLLSIFEVYYEKKLIWIHILINAFFILYPIYVTLKNYIYPVPLTPPRMIHAPTLGLLLGLMLLVAYPALSLFYIFGIKLMKHYFLATYKYIRISFILIYLIYIILIFGFSILEI